MADERQRMSGELEKCWASRSPRKWRELNYGAGNCMYPTCDKQQNRTQE